MVSRFAKICHPLTKYGLALAVNNTQFSCGHCCAGDKGQHDFTALHNGPRSVMSLQDTVISSFPFKEQPSLLCMITFFHRVFHLRLSCSLAPQFLQLQSRAFFRMNLTTFFLDLCSPIWQPLEMWLIQTEMCFKYKYTQDYNLAPSLISKGKFLHLQVSFFICNVGIIKISHCGQGLNTKGKHFSIQQQEVHSQ